MEMAGRAELILVIGSPSSSNSSRLREIGAQLGVPSRLVEGPEAIDMRWFDGVSRLGLSAGASATGRADPEHNRASPAVSCCHPHRTQGRGRRRGLSPAPAPHRSRCLRRGPMSALKISPDLLSTNGYGHAEPMEEQAPRFQPASRPRRRAPEPQPEAPKGRALYPFSALVGQEAMKTALLLTTVDPTIGGVLIFGIAARANPRPFVPSRRCCRRCAPWPVAPMPASPDARRIPASIAAACGRANPWMRRSKFPCRWSICRWGHGRSRRSARSISKRRWLAVKRAFQPGLLAKAHRGTLYRRGEPSRGSSRRCAARCRGLRRECGGARGPFHPPPRALRAHRSGNPEEGELRPQCWIASAFRLMS